jgi:maltooligosyltrehalose trehalohydrolase
LRAKDPVISRRRVDLAVRNRVAISGVAAIDGATLSEHALALRWFDADHGDRLLLVNFGGELMPGSIAEPLLAPPRGQGWQLLWSSESPQYGGQGTFEPVADHGRGAWRIQSQCAVLLIAAARTAVSNPRPEEAK